MHKVDLRKIYNFYPLDQKADPGNLPTGGDVYYECHECRGIVSSVTFIKAACECGNLEGNKGEVTVKEPARVTVVRGRLK
ncbi:MAG: hypothetical protein H6R10_2143 [Rhodocyclaceae bacterium]|nr:hypothetical protein [Rhodocyclaceae bacterium]